MTTPAEKIHDRILETPAPRDIEWLPFVDMWKRYADKVEEESGDRLAVEFHGHRVDFRRPHDGQVSIEDIERARHLLAAGPTSTEGEGKLLVLTVTDEDARFYDFDLSKHDVEESDHEHDTNPDSRGHHMRTVEKKTGRDDKHDLVHFFEELVVKLQEHHPNRSFVLYGHGTGTSNVAKQFEEYLTKHDAQVAQRIIAVGDIDLSAATPAVLEKAAKELAGQG